MAPKHKPPSAVTYHLLLALAGRDLHGYGLKKAVLSQTDGAIVLGAGTLYAAIRRLAREGLIEESGTRPDPEIDDERRRYYSLSPLGLSVLTEATEQLRTTMAVAEQRLDLAPMPTPERS